MFRTSALLFALFAGATATKKCKVPMFRDFYALSGTGRLTTESDSTNAEFPDFIQGPLGVNAEDKIGGQDMGYFSMVRDYDLPSAGILGFMKYTCMITLTADQALCTSVDAGNEEGPILQVTDQFKRALICFPLSFRQL